MSDNILKPLKPGQGIVSKFDNGYVLQKKIGGGGFGELWLAKCRLRGKGAGRTQAALKFESKEITTPSLRFEVEAYIKLGDKPFLPMIYDFFSWTTWFVMAMELLGKSLDDCYNYCVENEGRMSLKDTIQIAIQLLEAFQYIHSKGYIHRDIKPGNFMFGHKNSSPNQLRVVDFGLTKRYINDETNTHIKPAVNCMKMGTQRFMSIHAHMGYQQSRRDDLEAIAYMLISFVRVQLPWDRLLGNEPNQVNEEILYEKSHLNVYQLIQGNEDIPKIPEEFGDFLKAVKKLRFNQKPEYESYIKMFRILSAKEGIRLDKKFSWSPE